MPPLGIGAGEADAHTHADLVSPKNLVRASVHVVVDRPASAGLNFFAIQVDFANGTWAHGGVQEVTGENGARKRQVNWGGLVDRGGGSTDYDAEQDLIDIDRIQNPPTGQHLGPYDWKNGVEYEYVVQRGALVRLPPGDYRYLPERATVHVDHERSMWEWHFTVRPVIGPGVPFSATLYCSADSVKNFMVWNEAGYGSKASDQHTTWSSPLFQVNGAGVDQSPTAWKRF